LILSVKFKKLDYLASNALNKRFFLFNTIRLTIILLLSILFFFISITLYDFKQLTIYFLVIFVISITTSIYAFFKYKKLKLSSLVNILIIEDIILISLIVYVTGGSLSPFYFLYIIPIFISSILLSKRNTIFIGGFSFVIFGSISELMYLKVLPTFFIIHSQEIGFSSFVYNVFMALIAFISLAYLFSSFLEIIVKKDKELKSAKENLRDVKTFNTIVIENIEVGLITISDNGKILYSNKKGEEILNSKFMNIIMDIYEDINSNDKEIQKFYKEIDYDGKYFRINVSIIKDIYSFKRIFVFMIADFTNEKLIESKLKEKEHLALIGEMAAGIAHELRNPLASISGSVQYISKQLKLSDEYKKLMDIIIAESMRLSSTIEDFLNITKSYELNITEFDLSKMSEEIVELLEKKYSEIRFIKNIESDIYLRGDEKRIREVFWNIFTNSIKAVSKVKSPIIEIAIHRKEDMKIEVSIKDNGVGMDKEEIDKIFTPFYSRFSSGVGLGMFLVKRIIDEHGFDMKIISSKGIGTEVIIWMKS